MFEVDNKIWQEDIELIANNKILAEFKNSSFLITGTTGLIGSELVFSLLCANRVKGLNNKIYALVRNENKARELFKKVINDLNFNLIIQDVAEPIKIEEKIDYIIHCASVTSSKDMVEKPVDTILTMFNGTKNVLDFALKDNSKVLYLSSLEAYGIINSEVEIKEDELGYIDLTNPRSSYPESKRMAENLCASYSSQFGLDIKIARLTQTFGAGISKDDNRVFAQFAKSVIEKRDIVLHTKGETVRNYCYLTDAVIALFLILKKGKGVYNVANKNAKISIKDMATLIAQKYGISLKFEIDEINRGYNPTVKIALCSDNLEKLGWSAEVGLEEMYGRLIKYLSNMD
jgi:dTDP-glucose 4,6-dehydratase